MRYRTKIEFAIYVDENEILHLTQHIPGTKRGIVPVDEGSPLACDGLNRAAMKVVKVLNEKKLRKSQVKGIMVRYSYFENKSVVYIYIKEEGLNIDAGDFFDEELMKGVYIYHSTKKSPAFVQTSLISSIGEKILLEKLNNKIFEYPSDGFFQINIPVFAEFLDEAYEIISKLDSRKDLLDLYAGVGTIGISIGDLYEKVVGVELLPGSKEFAIRNATKNDVSNYHFFESRSEDFKLEEYLSMSGHLFLDPPRAGCDKRLIEKILHIKPEYIFYLSCNPETQDRDLVNLNEIYEIRFQREYDFFPGTKHSERFCVIKRR